MLLGLSLSDLRSIYMSACQMSCCLTHPPKIKVGLEGLWNLRSLDTQWFLLLVVLSVMLTHICFYRQPKLGGGTRAGELWAYIGRCWVICELDFLKWACGAIMGFWCPYHLLPENPKPAWLNIYVRTCLYQALSFALQHEHARTRVLLWNEFANIKSDL